MNDLNSLLVGYYYNDYEFSDYNDYNDYCYYNDYYL